MLNYSNNKLVDCACEHDAEFNADSYIETIINSSTGTTDNIVHSNIDEHD